MTAIAVPGSGAEAITVAVEVASDLFSLSGASVEQLLPGGDHEIVVGRVREVETGDESAAPLLYWQGTYGLLARTADRVTR